MPVRRRTDKRRQDVTDEQELWLRGEDTHGFFQFSPPDELHDFWNVHSDRIIAEWIENNPGTRPHRWWQYDAPEARKRLGGIGTPAYEVLAYVPSYTLGIPNSWVTPWQVAYYNGRARDAHNQPIGEPGREFNGVAIDEEDPPVYESQATYLKRLGLLVPGEERRVGKANWEAVGLLNKTSKIA